MIEFCTKKRMALAIVALIMISVIVLVVENNMSMGSDMKEITKAPENRSKECWDLNPSQILQECSPCTSYEMREKPYCKETGYREYVKCDMPSGVDLEVYRSCPKQSWWEERDFWIFESITGVIGVLAYGMVFQRQKRLDRLLLEKVHKQIASGV